MKPPRTAGMHRHIAILIAQAAAIMVAMRDKETNAYSAPSHYTNTQAPAQRSIVPFVTGGCEGSVIGHFVVNSLIDSQYATKMNSHTSFTYPIRIQAASQGAVFIAIAAHIVETHATAVDVNRPLVRRRRTAGGREIIQSRRTCNVTRNDVKRISIA